MLYRNRSPDKCTNAVVRRRFSLRFQHGNDRALTHLLISAAHLSNGNATKALEDAGMCIKANSSWAKGFARKGAALHKLRR